jgi:2-amino-4-hydroxy-6-hydroxymethyldihydropteridine diphosphokinase
LAAERRLGRVRGERWGPRTIDIDILVMEGPLFESGRLSLPHPRMTERAFVLAPLADIAPDMVVNGRSVAEWLAQLPAGGVERTAPPGAWWRNPDQS